MPLLPLLECVRNICMRCFCSACFAWLCAIADDVDAEEDVDTLLLETCCRRDGGLLMRRRCLRPTEFIEPLATATKASEDNKISVKVQ